MKDNNETEAYEALMEDSAHDIVPMFYREVEYNSECILWNVMLLFVFLAKKNGKRCNGIDVVVDVFVIIIVCKLKALPMIIVLSSWLSENTHMHACTHMISGNDTKFYVY